MPWSGQPPETTLVPKGHTTPGTIPVWVVNAATWGHADIWAGLLLRAMSGSMVLLWFVSLLMSTAHAMTRGHRNQAC